MKSKVIGTFRSEQGAKATPHKERLATLHAICLQISLQSLFRISQKCSWIHQVFTPLFVSSDEKFDDASVAQSLCGIALKKSVPRQISDTDSGFHFFNKLLCSLNSYIHWIVKT